VLALLMLIPLGQVNDLVREREGRAGEATAQIASRWGGVGEVRWVEHQRSTSGCIGSDA